MRHIAVSDADKRHRRDSEERYRGEHDMEIIARAARRAGEEGTRRSLERLGFEVMPSGRTLLCVDMSNQVYRAAAAHPMLTSRRVFTGGLYGFFAALGKMVRETRATHVAFCRDMKPYLRSAMYPEYKQLRKTTQDDDLLMMYRASFALVTEVFEACGIRMWGIEGFEADDLIGHCVMKYRHRFDRIYAASNDSDLYQLMWCPTFYLYKKSAALADHAGTLAAKGFTPEQYMLATALMGTHNDVAGIPRVGEVTAFKAVKDAALLRSYRERWSEVIERNLALIKLPHDAFPREANLPRHDSFNPRHLYKALGKYDIDVTGSMVSAVEAIQGGK